MPLVVVLSFFVYTFLTWSTASKFQKWKSCLILYTAQKMKFSIKDFLSKCNQIHRFLRIWSHLLKNFLMGNFIFCAVVGNIFSHYSPGGIIMNCLEFSQWSKTKVPLITHLLSLENILIIPSPVLPLILWKHPTQFWSSVVSS